MSKTEWRNARDYWYISKAESTEKQYGQIWTRLNEADKLVNTQINFETFTDPETRRASCSVTVSYIPESGGLRIERLVYIYIMNANTKKELLETMRKADEKKGEYLDEFKRYLNKYIKTI